MLLHCETFNYITPYVVIQYDELHCITRRRICVLAALRRVTISNVRWALRYVTLRCIIIRLPCSNSYHIITRHITFLCIASILHYFSYYIYYTRSHNHISTWTSLAANAILSSEQIVLNDAQRAHRPQSALHNWNPDTDNNNGKQQPTTLFSAVLTTSYLLYDTRSARGPSDTPDQQRGTVLPTNSDLSQTRRHLSAHWTTHLLTIAYNVWL